MKFNPLALTGVAAALLILTTACSANVSTPTGLSTGGPKLPPTQGDFDYQLSEPYDFKSHSNSSPVVARDSSASPLAHSYSICYVNGFQTQPGEIAADSRLSEVVLRNSNDALVVDPEWPDEYVLDPGTVKHREVIFRSRSSLIRSCAEKGFDAVEIDNLDTSTRFADISEEGAKALAKKYVDDAHRQGMAIAQKNSAEVASLGKHALGFDFAISEESGAFRECGAYQRAYGDLVFDIEYPDTLAREKTSFAAVCAEASTPSRTILRDRELRTPADPKYVYKTC